MPVSPADFYAYSQATGVQVPDSPEERAQLAPQVLQFRRNQLKQPQEQGIDPVSMGVGIGLALAGAGAGALALRGRNRIPKSTKTTGQSGVKVEDLNKEVVSRVANVGKSKKPASQNADLAAQVDEAAQNISQNALTDFQKRQTPAVADQQANAAGSGEDQMTGRVRQQLQRNEDLNLMQVDALEDVNQQTTPSSSDSPITRAAAQTNDGVPIDQAEGISSQATPDVKNFLIEQRRKVWDEMANDHTLDPLKNPPPTHARVEAELAQRLGPGAYKFGPSFSANRQAMEIYALTGDPRVTAKEFGLSPVTFETFENMPEEKARVFESAPVMSTEGYPSENLTPVIEETGIKVNVPGAGEVDLAALRKPVVTESTAQSAEDFYQSQIGKRKDWITGKETEIAEQYKTINEIKRQEIVNSLESVENILNQAIDRGNTKMANSMRARKQKLESQFENPDTYISKDPNVNAEDNLLKARLRGVQRKGQEMLAETDDIKKYPTTIDWSGGTPRVFGVQDPVTGEFIPETMELRSEKYAIELDPKSGGGRKAVEFDPEGQSGQAKDIYGVRKTTDRPDDPSLRPSQPKYSNQELLAEMAKNEMGLNPEMLSVIGKTGSGDVPVAGDYDTALEIARQTIDRQPVTEARRRSVLMSEAVRKANRQRSERNPTAGKIPSEMTMLRRQMETMVPQPEQLGPRIEYSESATPPPQQRTIPGVIEYGARQQKSPADIAAQQLESYMSKRMMGRSTPLSSEAVIQPRLF